MSTFQVFRDPNLQKEAPVAAKATVTVDEVKALISRFERAGKKIVVFCENPNNDPEVPEMFSVSTTVDAAFLDKAQVGVTGGVGAAKDFIKKHGKLIVKIGG